MPRSKGKEAKKTEITMWDCIKRDPERVGEESRKRATHRRNWRLLIENTVRERLEEEKTMETEIMVDSCQTTGMPRKEQQQNAI